MGGPKIESPAPPAAPTVAQSMSDYVASYPALFKMQQEFAPQEAAMQVGLAEKYAGSLGTAYKTAQDAMYPEESALTKKLNEQVQAGISGEVPQWQKDAWMDTFNANLGTNIGSGIGSDYVSRGMLQQVKGWGDYYRDLALSITGRQPIATAQTPQTTNQLANYTPQGVMNYNSSNYGSFTGLYGNMYNTNAQMASQNAMMPYYYMTGTGNMLSGIGSMMGGGGKK